MNFSTLKTAYAGLFLCLGCLTLPIRSAVAEEAPPSVEAILRSCSEFSAALTNFSVKCTHIYDHEKPLCHVYKIGAALPDRLQVLSDSYFSPVVWTYSLGQVSIFRPSSGALSEHPALSATFPFAPAEHPEDAELGLHHSLYLPDLLSGRLADRLLADAIDPAALIDANARYANRSSCYAVQIPQTDQTTYDLRIQKGPTPFLLSIRLVTARTDLRSDLTVEEKVLAEERYGQWQINDPDIQRKLTEAGPAPEPTEDEVAIVEEAEAPADDAERTNGIPVQTASSYEKQQNAFLTKIISDHFAARADPQLPDRARILKFLADYRQYTLHDTPRADGERLLAEAETLLNEHPDLPTLRYVTALLLYYNHQREGVAGISGMLRHKRIYPMLESAHADFRSGPWNNPYLAMRSAFWRAHMHSLLPDPQWAETAWQLYLELFDNPWFVQQNAAVLVSTCGQFVRGHNPPISQKTRNVLADFEPVKEANPWLYHMLCGVTCLEQGWDADEYLRAKDPLIHKAIVHLSAAYRLDPSRPEAASYMITAMLARGRHEAMRKWFDRAVRAEMDHPQAYGRYVACLWPIWGGTDDEWYAFGEECLRTGRFDTSVPGHFLEAVQAISRHNADSPLDVYRRPGCYENLMALFDGWQALPVSRGSKTYWDSRKAAYAWACQRYSEAAEILARLGPNFDDSVLPELNAGREQIRDEVELFASSRRESAEKSLERLAQGDLAGARQEVNSVLSNLEAADRSRSAFERLLQKIQAREAFASGQWISLLQPTAITWDSPSGGWRFQDGQLLGQMLSDRTPSIQCRFPLAGDFELQGTVEFGELPESEYGEAMTRELRLGLGVAENDECPRCGISLIVYERPPRAVVRGIGSGSGEVTVNGIRFDNPSTFLIRKTNGSLSVTWNDQVIADGHVHQPPDGQEHPYTLSFSWNGTEVGKPGTKFTSLKAKGSPASDLPSPSPTR